MSGVSIAQALHSPIYNGTQAFHNSERCSLLNKIWWFSCFMPTLRGGRQVVLHPQPASIARRGLNFHREHHSPVVSYIHFHDSLSSRHGISFFTLESDTTPRWHHSVCALLDVSSHPHAPTMPSLAVHFALTFASHKRHHFSALGHCWQRFCRRPLTSWSIVF